MAKKQEPNSAEKGATETVLVSMVNGEQKADVHPDMVEAWKNEGWQESK